MAADPLSHAALCKLAAAWLRRASSKGGPGCQVAVSETHAGFISETPDAFGLRYSDSTLIEVKVSRADFHADAAKPFRAAGGMGLYRYYMAPAGLIRIDELPPKWGLLEVSPRKQITVACGHVVARNAYFGSDSAPGLEAWRNERDIQAELAFIVRLFARVGDPEALNQQIKTAQRMANDSARVNDRLRKEIQKLRDEKIQRWLESAARDAGVETPRPG